MLLRDQPWYLDCANRGMASRPSLVALYLKEVQSVKDVEKRIKEIDQKISEMSMEERTARRVTLAMERKVLKIGSPELDKAFSEAATIVDFPKRRKKCT